MAETAYTTEQQRVIAHDGGHAVVAAVAGSGKTETLIGRVRHLLKDHSADRIAVVMFNRDAAQSFRRRFEKVVKGPAPEIRTFNSMGNRIVNRFVELGLLPDAEIVEKDYRRSKIARSAFTTVFKQLEGEDAAPDKELVDAFVEFVKLVKCDVRSAEEVFEERRYGKAAAGFPQAFDVFEQERGRQKIRFFEDQLYDPVKLMLRRQETQKAVTNRMDHLIVDEAQDMNAVQIALLRILAGTRAKVMLVGDEDQAIYEWRGAKPDYLTRGFEKDFSNATRYTMPHTFRFGHELSLAASQLITRNANRNPKISISADGTPRTRVHPIGLSLGLSGLGDEIAKVVADGAAPDDIAVLVRTYSMSVSLELELHHHKIAHYVYGRPPLNRIPEISALVGVLQLASGRWQSLAAEDVRSAMSCLLQRPTLYLDKETTRRLVDDVMDQPGNISNVIRSAITPRMKAFQADQVRDRADLLEIIALDTPEDETVVAVLDRYLEGTNFKKLIEKDSPSAEHAEAVLANVAAFRTIAQRHEGTVKEFLAEIDPLIDSTNVEPPNEPHVWIGSIHRAKGAQWSQVFVPGLAARTFPRDDLEVEQLEAERRLFYVAATRAIDDLYLAHPVHEAFTDSVGDVRWDKERPAGSGVSPFLWEMDLGLAKHAAECVHSQGGFTALQLERPHVANAYFERFPFARSWAYGERPKRRAVVADAIHPKADLVPGQRVSHSTFGPGVVDRWVDHRVVRVKFDSGDSRMLVANLAQLKLAGRRVQPPMEINEDEIPF